MMESHPVFRQRLERLTDEKIEESNYKLNRAKIAKGIGTKPSTFTEWINGNKEPQMKSVVALAKYFNVSIDYLFGLSDYADKQNEAITLKSVGLSEKAAIAMHCDSSVSPALNLLFETEAFRNFLNAFWKFFHACEADHIADRIIEDLMIEHNTANPDNKVISEKLVERSNDNALDNETQCFLMCLSDRYEKATGGAIYCPQEVENVFGDGLRLSDIYEYQAQRLFFSLLDDLQKKTRTAF